jgi:hypothetical protein
VGLRQLVVSPRRARKTLVGGALASPEKRIATAMTRFCAPRSWLGSREATLPRRVLLLRLAGALLLAAAILLVVV